MERDLAVMYYVFLIFAGCLARIGHLELENEKCDMSYNDYFSNSINQKGKSVHIHNSMYNIYILCIHLEKYSLVYLFFFNEFSWNLLKSFKNKLKCIFFFFTLHNTEEEDCCRLKYEKKIKYKTNSFISFQLISY